MIAEQDAAGEYDAAIQSGRRLVALDPLSEFGQRALIRAYARAGRRGEALRQYKRCAETLKREFGVAPDVETQALANEIARSSAIREPNTPGPAADDQDCAVLGTAPDRGTRKSSPSRREVLTSGTPKTQWSCVFPNIAVAVAPLRNLTGDADQQNLVEAFTDDLVTDLLRHGRGLSLKQLADERAALAKLPRAPEPERGYDYVVTGSAQRSAPGLLRVNMRITDAATSEYLWAGRREFKPEDLALVQTRITRRISRELHILLLQAASRRAFIASNTELGVAECLSHAVSALQRGMRAEHSADAQRWYLAALARDPRSVEALVGVAFTCQHLRS